MPEHKKPIDGGQRFTGSSNGSRVKTDMSDDMAVSRVKHMPHTKAVRSFRVPLFSYSSIFPQASPNVNTGKYISKGKRNSPVSPAKMAL